MRPGLRVRTKSHPSAALQMGDFVGISPSVKPSDYGFLIQVLRKMLEFKIHTGIKHSAFNVIGLVVQIFVTDIINP